MPLVEALDLTLVHQAHDPHDGPRCCTVVSDLARSAALLRKRAEAAPQASLLLARLLRIGESLPVSHALDLESLTYSTLLAEPGFAQWLAARGDRHRAPPSARVATSPSSALSAIPPPRTSYAPWPGPRGRCTT
jgi:hypothetical protein